MNLPSFPTYSKDTDVNKQLAQMRSYLNMLKDDIESELMNIGYENLDADLRGRFDNINNMLATSQNQITEIAGTLKVKYITAEEIASKYVTTQYLQANYITASQISASYASFAWVEALDAMVGNLNAKAITTDNLSAQSIDAGQIRTGTISASRISTQSLFSSGMINSLSLWCNKLCTYQLWTGTGAGEGKNIQWVQRSSGGYYLVGYDI